MGQALNIYIPGQVKGLNEWININPLSEYMAPSLGSNNSVYLYK